ncbi:hypothetical protein [Streptomyces colonosanans]|uniref:Uncharacterized protein n=1 Tax=Streptomyces colonosanans TaxID=1428652 RepID=A0A1S2PCT9_9ACTN|nr:hypothetical protein [Streptomyces colonosanans]OIJ91618.1 hypothetical protein BIV24_15250 [Streptomyces colonosanans]
MTYPTPYAVRLADEITRQLGQLSNDLHRLPADQAMQVTARILDPDNGVLGAFTQLVGTGSRIAKDQAERGSLPAEVWLALGRTANELNDIGLDLDDHTDILAQFGAPTSTATAKPPAPAPLVARRRR